MLPDEFIIQNELPVMSGYWDSGRMVADPEVIVRTPIWASLAPSAGTGRPELLPGSQRGIYKYQL